MISLSECQELVRKMMGEKRFYHSLCVSKEAKRLAEKYGANPQKAEIAGMLHDICKEIPENEQLKIIADFDIIMNNVEKSTQRLYHAISGSVYLKNVVKIGDEEIIGAVRWHTSGRKGMTLLEKVIFTADFTSDDRDYPDADEMRRLAEISLESAMLFAFSYNIKKLAQENSLIDINTVNAYNEIINLRKNKREML